MSRQFLRGAQIAKPTTARWFTQSSTSRNTNEMNKNTQSSKTEDVLGARMHHVTNFDRRMLVWVKRYPSIAEVPEKITHECLLSSRSKARIKACNYMIVATVIGCIGAVLLGKRQAATGENLAKQRSDWYKEIHTEKDK